MTLPPRPARAQVGATALPCPPEVPPAAAVTQTPHAATPTFYNAPPRRLQEYVEGSLNVDEGVEERAQDRQPGVGGAEDQGETLQ